MLLNEHTSYDDINAEGRGKSRLLPIKLAFRYLKGKGNELKSYTINLKNSNDYNILWKQLMNAGSKISLLKIDPQTGTKVEMGPRSFAKALDILGIEDVTDLQDFIEDPVYREMLETEEKIKFSFGKEKRKELDTNKRRITTTKDLAAIGIDIDGEGESWEWGNGEDDMMKLAPEGRDIWVIRAHEYPEYPCIFVYPYEGNRITDYDTALDLFFMDICKADGVIYDYYDPKKFNLLWVACPCRYDWFKKHPTPTSDELARAKRVADEIQANQTAIEDTDYDTYEDDFNYRIAEQEVIKDRNKLKRLVESYGKKDVLNFVKHLNESYTSDDFANAIYNWQENDDETLYNMMNEISVPYAKEFHNYGINISFSNDSPDESYTREYKEFRLGMQTPWSYEGDLSHLRYNGDIIDFEPSLKVDALGNIIPGIYVTSEEGQKIYDVNESDPKMFVSTFCDILDRIHNKRGPKIERLISSYFNILNIEEI